jgi:hypothetical protein
VPGAAAVGVESVFPGAIASGVEGVVHTLAGRVDDVGETVGRVVGVGDAGAVRVAHFLQPAPGGVVVGGGGAGHGAALQPTAWPVIHSVPCHATTRVSAVVSPNPSKQYRL